MKTSGVTGKTFIWDIFNFFFRIKLTDPPTSIRNAIQIAELEERMALEKAILQELTKVRLSNFEIILDNLSW